MSLAYHAPRVALAAALLTVTLRARSAPPLRPLAAVLLALALFDAARLASPPRCLDVALFAAWWPALALAVAGPLTGRWRALTVGAAAWWALATARALPLHGAALAAEWWALWALSTAAQVGAVAAWARRAWRRREAPTLPARAALVIAAGSLADAVGPWAAGAGGAVARWEVGRWQGAATWVGVGAVVGWGWWREGRGEKKSSAERL